MESKDRLPKRKEMIMLDSIRPERKVPKVGEHISWKTIAGIEYNGIVIEMDSNVAIVRLPDGTQKAVEF